MRILVTGGAGFIGSHIVKQLLEQNHEVVVYDIEKYQGDGRVSKVSNGNSEKPLDISDTFPSSPTFILGDVKDTKLLVESLSGVDAVIHMASFISVEESVKNPLKYMDNNVLGTASLLIAMREAAIKKIVFSSSATVYGEPESLPILENAPLSAFNPYAASKIAMEALCESFSRTDGFDVTILRYFNPYGPGENHVPETHAIPNFIKAGIDKRPVPLYWKGEQVRDFIYVEDLAAAHIAVLDQSGYKVFNVGAETGVKIIDILTKLSYILGYELEVEDLGKRKGDVMANYASSAKLKEATGWEAKVSLEEGLRKTVEYFKGDMGEKGDSGN